jgi:predicted transcriptional regulator
MKILSLELDVELHKELKRAALERDTTIKDLVTQAIKKELEHADV